MEHRRAGAWLLVVLMAGGFPLLSSAQTSDSRPLAEADTTDLAAGKRLYVAQCALCHGIDGSGGYGPSLLVPVLARAADDGGLLKVVDQGIPNLMPGYGRANGPRRTWQLAAYVRSLGAGSAVVVGHGDAGRGRAIYQERGCGACHVLEGAGRAFGPDLSNIGAQRGAGYIKQALLEPSARVPEGHVVVTAKPKDAGSVRGVRISEDVFWVYVRDPAGRVHRYWKSDLDALEREAGASLMPAYGPLAIRDRSRRSGRLPFQSAGGSDENTMAVTAGVVALGTVLAGQVPYSRIVNAVEGARQLAHLLGRLQRALLAADQITPTNVASCASLGASGGGAGHRSETTPLVADGVMYITEPPTTVTALDTRTGGRSGAMSPADAGGPARARLPADNRGVALLGDQVFVGTIDGWLYRARRQDRRRALGDRTSATTRPATRSPWRRSRSTA